MKSFPALTEVTECMCSKGHYRSGKLISLKGHLIAVPSHRWHIPSICRRLSCFLWVVTNGGGQRKLKVMMLFPLGHSERVGYCFKPLRGVCCACFVKLTGAVSSGDLQPLQEPVGKFQGRGGWASGRMAEGKFLGWKVCSH